MRRLSDRPDFRGRSGLLVSRPDVCIAVSMHPWWVLCKVEEAVQELRISPVPKRPRSALFNKIKKMDLYNSKAKDTLERRARPFSSC